MPFSHCRAAASLLFFLSLLSAPLSAQPAAKAGLSYPFSRKLEAAAHKPQRVRLGMSPGIGLDPSQQNDTALQARLDTVLTTIGRGFNRFSGQMAASTCTTGMIYGPVPSTINVSYALQMITSFEQFSEETAVEASVSSSFGSFSASVKGRFEKAMKSGKRTEFVLLKETVRQSPEINLRDVGIDSYFANYDLSIDREANEFYGKCGDSYISQLQMGGELVALLQIEENSEQLNSNRSIEATAGGFSTNVSASFNQKMESLKNQGSVNFTLQQLGGDGRALPGATMDELIKYANDFPSQVRNETGVVVSFVTTPYLSILSLGHTSDFVDERRNFSRVEANRDGVGDALAALIEEKNALADLSVPVTKTAGDINDLIDAAIAKDSALMAAFAAPLDACARQFWAPRQCVFGADLMTAAPVPTPFVGIMSVDSRGTVARMAVPVDSYVELRGNYCFSGADNCGIGINGVTRDGRAYMIVNGTRYYGTPIIVPAGAVTSQAIDSDYGDNFGNVKAVIYQK